MRTIPRSVQIEYQKKLTVKIMKQYNYDMNFIVVCSETYWGSRSPIYGFRADKTNSLTVGDFVRNTDGTSSEIVAICKPE